MVSLRDFLNKRVKIKSLTHDGMWEEYIGTLVGYHEKGQFFLKDYAIYHCNLKSKKKEMVESGTLLMITVKTLAFISTNEEIE